MLGLAGANALFALTDGPELPESQDAVLHQRHARRRLVGAIALVLFVVIVLPIVFDREPRPITQDLVIEIPSQDSKFAPRAAPLSAPAQATPAPAQAASAPENPPAAETPKAEAPKSEEAKITEPPKVGEKSKAAQKPKPAETPKAEASEAKAPVPKETKSDESFVVPLGAYSNAANAKQVQSRVAAAGYRSYSESFNGAKGAQLRVRAGPFPSRDAAEHAREKLKSMGLNPVGPVASREQP